MRPDRHIAIIGGGQAAARTIAALRDGGYEGRTTLIGEEPDLPYERPPLSKDALCSGASASVPPMFDSAWYQERQVELRLGSRVEAIDAGSGRITLAMGSSLQADRIVLATGVRARRMTIPGVSDDRVLGLRSLADARRLRAALEAGRRVLILGGGFIGLEVAASAVRLGCQVTVVEARGRLLERAVSATTSALVSRLHGAHGVVVKRGCQVVSARQGHDEIEVVLSDGSTCVVDLIVAGVGAQANDELARAAGLRCGNGVEVDRHCRTDAERVWAVGDIACRRHDSWGAPVRIESWDNAEWQAAIAGGSLARSWSRESRLEPGADLPAWFWTDQYDLNLQILGEVTDADRTVTRPGRKEGESMAFHFRAGVLRGIELIACGRERVPARRLLQQGWSRPPEMLGDTGLSLKELSAMAREPVTPIHE
ncbi:NAD(P)/FAD-dependent oxidoreductase [Xylophilus sp. GOD-11R]|uniref:NAD(P)/FAD-dependent oxidoreductase n=1 Tax=Xylophilus sp. GOD-11R TaxID=3089814 RepID=UPI00298D1224|nr:FAD-dependent oxidoreductase [Xylophilus sp. GOD-11R]WPB57163.1 FAD-dependent oxidoreductase [Xylophilus sp. GOD-11R]